MQTQTSNTLHNVIMEAGSKDRPPMLAPGSPITRTERFQETYKNVSQEIRNQLNAEAEVVQIILTGIDNDIYSTVDACPNACEMWKAIERLKQGESINKIYKPTNNNHRTSSNTSRANQDNSPRINRNAGYENQRIGNVAGARENVGSSVVQKSRIQCYNYKEFRHVARKCQKPKRAKDAAYHREKMLLCKQEEAGIQLNVEQADWRDDTDDESEDQELKAHYMYMAQIQEVTPDYVDNSVPIFDTEPLQKVQNNDNYNVFAIECEHSEKSKSIHDTYPIEQDENNVIIDSLDMSYDREQIDQNDDDDDDLTNERELLDSLIEKLKCEIDDSKNQNKFLETSNKDKGIVISELKKLIEKLKGKSVDTKFEKSSVIRQPNAFKSQRPSVMGKPTTFSNSFVRKDFSKSKSVTQNNMSNDFSKPVTAQALPPNKKSILKNTNVLALGIVIPTTSVSRPQLKSNPMGDRVMRNNSQGKNQEVEDQCRNVKFYKNKTSVTACNDSLNAKTLNVNSSESVLDTYPTEQDAHNVIIDSMDMSYDREEIDQNDDDNDLANEREFLASLIEKLKCEIDESKNRNKFLETSNKVLIENLKVQTMNMLNNKCRTSFAKPEFLKKAQRANPRLCDIGCYNGNLALMLAPEFDEVILLEKESRSKLSDLIRPFNYNKLNNLYDLFVPQRKKSSKQRYFSERSRLSHTSVNNGNSKESFNKQTTLLEKRMDESIPLDKKCQSSIEIFKVKTCLNEEMVADLRYFNSLELEVESLISQLETQKTQFLNEIDRLSREYYYADHMNAILGVYTELDEVTNLQCDYLELLENVKVLKRSFQRVK
nr:Gag-Pol polyprotein [Tanacetum cinerariifolium]